MTTTLRKLGLGVAAAGLAWAGAALAENTTTTDPGAPTQTGKSSDDQVLGKVEKISHSDSSISVRSSDQKEQKLKIDSGTAVVKDGRRAKFDDIEPGDQVRASMAGSGDCTRLEVTSTDARNPSAK